MRFQSKSLLACAMAVAVTLSGSCSAQQRLPRPVADQQVAAPDQARPALWRVSDADTTIYLFGTVHALPEGVQWLDGPVATAFEASDELVTEIVESSPAEMQALVVNKAMLAPGKSLRTLLPPKDRLALETALRQHNLPVESFDRFEPWYAAIALATLPLLRDGYATENGVETALDARAKSLNRPHLALETAEYQLGLFDSLPFAVQKRYLREVITGMPQMRAELAAIIAAWQVGDAEKLARLMNEDESDPALEAALLTNRNRNWAGWIKQRLDRPGAVFVAVGAGHLAGRGSVQDQLKTLGFTTTRVQ